MHGDFVVKTVPLHHLTSNEAVKLLVAVRRQTAGGGVFEVSPNVRAVTIREVPKIFAEMMMVLGQYDRDPATVTLNFQLIAAENSNTRDPGVAGLDSLLRGVLKYTGYRLLTTSVATASEGGIVTQTLSADGETFTLQVFVTDMRVDGNDASVHLSVHLTRNGVASKGTSGESGAVDGRHCSGRPDRRAGHVGDGHRAARTDSYRAAAARSGEEIAKPRRSPS